MKSILKIIRLLIVALIPLTVVTAQPVSVTEFGAIGDGKTLNTNMIQSAIDYRDQEVAVQLSYRLGNS